MDKLPDTPQIVSSIIGGPLAIFVCTPLRNGLTLGSRDKSSGVLELYKKTSRGGLRAGWTGGLAPACIACPQFLALGPIYHCLNNSSRHALGVHPESHSMVSSCIAACGAGVTETLLTYSTQSRNAQMAYNNAMVTHSSLNDHSRPRVPLTRSTQFWGPGAGALALRNSITLASVRAISPALNCAIGDSQSGLGPQGRAALCDATASVFTCIVSTPIHQTFNFLATSPEAQHLCFTRRWDLISGYLKEQYLVPKQVPKQTDFAAIADLTVAMKKEYTWRFSRVAIRDFGMRATYITSVFTLFMTMERACCANFRVHVQSSTPTDFVAGSVGVVGDAVMAAVTADSPAAH